MVWVFVINYVVAYCPEDCAVGAGLGIGKRRLRVVARVRVAFSLTPFLNGQPVACWAVEDVIAIGEGRGYAMTTNGGAEKVAESILFSL